tara:strand:+ start:95 stop:1333 length:1239 start_codon:yes stop_codon:yes gene_type:complete
MNLRDRLLLAPINNLNREEFRESFQKITSSDREFFFKKILYDKYSPIFLNYINNHQLENLFNKKELARLRNQSKRFQIHSLQIVNELIYINKLFKKKGLNPTYLKGAALMNEYKDLSLRPLVDIDILFKGEEVFDAYNVLKENNYKERIFSNQSIEDLRKYMKNKHELPELHRDTNIMIEIHHRVTRRSDFENCPLSEKIIRNRRSINFYGVDIHIPAIEDVIVHQLVHFSINTRFNQLLRVFSDIKQIESNYQVDWNEIYSFNENQKVRKSLSLSLEVINFHFILTNGFDDLKNNYKIYFPKKEITLDAYGKTFKLEKTQISEDVLYRLGKSKSLFDFFRIVFSKIFVTRDQIVNDHNVLKSNYFNLIYFRSLSIFSRLLNYSSLVLNLLLKRGSVFQDFKRLEKIEKWLN